MRTRATTAQPLPPVVCEHALRASAYDLPGPRAAPTAPEQPLESGAPPERVCVPGATSACPPRGERPRIVLDESLTPTEAGLPALSADGTEVALAVTDAETATSALLVRCVRASDGAPQQDYLIVSPEEALTLEDADAPAPALRAQLEARITAFTAAMTHGGFTPLASAPLSAGTTGASAHRTSAAAGFTLDFDPSTGTLVALTTDRRELLRATLEPRVSRCEGRDVTSAASLSSAWLDAARGVLVVRAQYASPPRCSAPPPVERVFHLAL